MSKILGELVCRKCPKVSDPEAKRDQRDAACYRSAINELPTSAILTDSRWVQTLKLHRGKEQHLELALNRDPLAGAIPM